MNSPCKNERCRNGEDGKPKPVPEILGLPGSSQQYCSKRCRDADAQRREYDRLKRKVKLKPCESCSGTGSVEVPV